MTKTEITMQAWEENDEIRRLALKKRAQARNAVLCEEAASAARPTYNPQQAAVHEAA